MNENTKIVIAGGKSKADFLIGILLQKGYEVKVINEDIEYCKHLSQKYNIPIIKGDPARSYVLNDADIHGYDIIIALRNSDADNLVICQSAKQIYGIKRTVATVSNPKNVDVFKKLSINTVISATYTVANIIEQASIVGDIVNTLSVQDEEVVITKLRIDEDYPVVNKQIMDINFPENIIISCIIRDTGVTVPNGQTIITKGDKLLIISEPSLQDKVIEVITGKKAKER